MSTFWPDRYRTMGKSSNAFYSKNTRWSILLISRLSYVRSISITVSNLSFGSFEVILGQVSFLLVTFDRIEIEQWCWIRSAPLDKAYRLICTTIYLGHNVTLCDLDMRPTFSLGFFANGGKTATPFLAYVFIHHLHSLTEKVSPRSSQVRSPN